MARYDVSTAAVDRARRLIDAGEVDATTSWSDAAPSPRQEVAAAADDLLQRLEARA